MALWALDQNGGIDGWSGWSSRQTFDWVLKVSGCTVLPSWVSDKEMGTKTRLWIISRSTTKYQILSVGLQEPLVSYDYTSMFYS